MVPELQKIVVLCVVAAAVAAGAWWYFGFLPPQAEEPIACTADAMQCPDGSWVGRTGPNCEFVCPDTDNGSGGGTGGGILPYNSGVRGTVMLGPTCPVMRDPPDPNCADRPYQTTITIFRAGDPARVLMRTQSDAQGVFEASLPPGEYLVAAEGGAVLPRCSTQEFSVAPDTYTPVAVSCDTGIR